MVQGLRTGAGGRYASPGIVRGFYPRHAAGQRVLPSGICDFEIDNPWMYADDADLHAPEFGVDGICEFICFAVTLDFVPGGRRPIASPKGRLFCVLSAAIEMPSRRDGSCAVRDELPRGASVS